MSWREHIRKASWRGVPFYVVDTTTIVGRKMVLHEYPFQDVPYVEDLGKAADEYTIIGHVIQNSKNNLDYFNDRDRLLKALRDESGEGTLVHPFLGMLKVAIAGRVQMTESFREGGIARFEMRFVQSGVNTYPSPSTDHANVMDTQRDLSDAKVATGFGKKYSVSRLKSFLSSEAVKDITAGYQNFKDNINSVKELTTSTRSNVLNTIASAESELASIVTAPGLIIGNITTTFNTAFDTLKNFPGNVVSLVRATLRFGDFESGLDSIPLTSDSRDQQDTNRQVIIDVFRYEAIAQAAQIAANVVFDSSTEAIEIMKLIIETLDNNLIQIGDDTPVDDIYQAVEKFRPLIVKAMKEYGATNIPVLLEHKVGFGARPAILLAYEKYKDLSREYDIIDRNKPLIKHPGFMPGGEIINILSS